MEDKKKVYFDESNLKEHEDCVKRGEYGTMKIEEPKTPFARPASPADSASEHSGSDMEEDEAHQMDTGELIEVRPLQSQSSALS